jgi:hypothetical protein
LRASEDALEEAVLFYAGISLSVQVSRAETLQEEGSYGIFWNPGKVVRFCRSEGLLIRDETWWMLVQWVLS